MRMQERIVTIKNRAGMHARPAALLVKTASRFTAQVYIEKDEERVNGKSIMGVITLGATYDTPLKLIADGPDESAALDAIALLFENRFEEE
jgi:phosphocarrier protein HPr